MDMVIRLIGPCLIFYLMIEPVLTSTYTGCNQTEATLCIGLRGNMTHRRKGGCIADYNCDVILRVEKTNNDQRKWTLSILTDKDHGGAAWFMFSSAPLNFQWVEGTSFQPPFALPYADVQTPDGGVVKHEVMVLFPNLWAKPLTSAEKTDYLSPNPGKGSTVVEEDPKGQVQRRYRLFHFSSRSVPVYRKRYPEVNIKINLNDPIYMGIVHWNKKSNQDDLKRPPDNYYLAKEPFVMLVKDAEGDESGTPSDGNDPGRVGDTKEGDLGVTAIIGIVLLSLAVLGIIATIILACCLRKKKKNSAPVKYKTDVVAEAAGFTKSHYKKSLYKKKKPASKYGNDFKKVQKNKSNDSDVSKADNGQPGDQIN